MVFDVSQLRRERIAERMKALQELVPNANKVSKNEPEIVLAALTRIKIEAN